MRLPCIRRWFLFAGLLTVLAVGGCLNDSSDPDLDVDATSISDPAIELPTPTATLTAEPTAPNATVPPSLLEPGPPGLVSPVTFFLAGPDVWMIDGDLEVQQVTRQRRARRVATVPGTDSAAVVLIGSQGGRETEEIRIVDASGSESEPIYGPEIVADPGGNPRVAKLAWSSDGQRLAIVRDDDSIWVGGLDQPATPLPTDDSITGIQRVGWAAAGNALWLLVDPPGEAGTIRLIQLASNTVYDIAPLQSFSDACWLPGQARLVVTEARMEGRNPHTGSLFTIQLDGADRRLLTSAGEFGPAVTIGQLIASPDGTHLAFTVEAPDSSGEFRFRSLYLLEISSGVRRELEVASGQLVNEIWWFEGGLAWRSTAAENGQEYDGVEPFLIEVADLESSETRLVFSSNEE